MNSGNSFVGEIQTGLFYPLNLIAVGIFGTSAGMPIGALEGIVIVHFVLASVGMYLFCRAVGMSHLAAAFAGILFSYTGAHSTRAMAQVPIFITYSLVPFAPYFAVCYAKTGRLAFAALGGVAIGIQALAGHFAAPFLTGLICLAIIFTCRPRSLSRDAGATILLGTCALVVAGPQLFFGLQHFVDAYRIVTAGAPILATSHIPLSEIDRLALEPSGLLTFFDPERFWGGIDGNGLFIGLMPIAILVTCFADSRVRSHVRSSLTYLWPLYVLAAFSLVLAIGTATPIGRVWYSLPVLSSIVRETGRYVLIFAFAIATLCGLALDGLVSSRDGEPEKRFGLRSGSDVTIVVYALFAIYLTYVYLSVPTLHPALWFVGLALVAINLTPRRIGMIALVALGLVETMADVSVLPHPIDASYAPYVFRESEVFRLPEACYPSCRTFVDAGENVPANIGDVLRFQTIGGYTALIDRKYRDFLLSGDLAFDLLNVRYIVTAEPRPALREVARDDARGLFLYERTSAYPRVFSLASALARNVQLNNVEFTILGYDDLDQRFSIRVPTAEVVVFSEQFYPGWSVSIDGAPATLYVANLRFGPPIFRAIRVAAGPHTVEFHYPTL